MKTVASILRKERLAREETVEDISRATKIHPKFIKALEQGDYSAFSSVVHLKGFLKNYARHLELNVSEVLAFWRREYKEKDQTHTLRDRSRPLLTPRVLITPNRVIFGVTLLLILGFFGYLAYQYRSFARSPHLEVGSPAADIRQKENTIDIFGQVSEGATLTVNGQELEGNLKGEFATTIGLSEGVNTLIFVAVNQLGRETKLTRVVVVEPEKFGELSATSPAQPLPPSGVVVKIDPHAAWIRVYEGKNKAFEGLLVAGAQRVFSGDQPIKIYTGNAGSTRVIVNGKDQGVMGEEGEVVEREFLP